MTETSHETDRCMHGMVKDYCWRCTSRQRKERIYHAIPIKDKETKEIVGFAKKAVTRVRYNF